LPAACRRFPIAFVEQENIRLALLLDSMSSLQVCRQTSRQEHGGSRPRAGAYFPEVSAKPRASP
jgi:hypothetical protein